MTKNEQYISNLIETMDWDIHLHRCSSFANGTIFMKLIYKDQQHVMCMNEDQAELIANALLDSSIKLREEKNKES